MRAVGRILIAILGFMAALLAAAVFLVAARFGLAAVPAEPVDMAEAAVWIGVVTSVLGAAAFAPAVIYILATEILGVRSLIVHVGAGGLLGAVAALGRLVLVDHNDGALAMTAAGFVGGFVYWLVAGRAAGLASPQPLLPPGPPAA